MPLVIEGAPPSATTKPRIFLSYAREDIEEVRIFVDHLLGAARAWDLPADQIFYDEPRLHAGMEWETEIMDEIGRADLFLLIVSHASLKPTSYCYEYELKAAVRNGLRIVPILLSACEWSEQPLPGAPGRKLGGSQAVPVLDGEFLPVKNWDDRNLAWTAVTRAIGGTVTSFHANQRRTGGRPARVLPLLLPYTCNQAPLVASFEAELERWDACALILLLKGEYDDNIPVFWERLRREHLLQFVQESPLRGPTVGIEQTIVLPVSGQGSAEDRRRMLLYEFSMLLTQNRYRLRSVAQLSDHLKGLDGTIVLVSFPEAELPAELCQAIETLLSIIEELDDAVARRLLVSVHIEHPDLAGRSLVHEWGLNRFPNSTVVELRPGPVTLSHARKWFYERRLGEHFGLDEDDVLAPFATDAELRFRIFHRKLQPLFRSLAR